MALIKKLLFVSLVIVFVVMPVLGVRPQRFQHFDDYLNSLATDEKEWFSEMSATSTASPTDEDSEEDSDDSEEDATTPPPTTTTPQPSLVGISSTPQNREVTCCLLGQLAGDKGYHCYVQYYAARLIMRNRNRAHNRKMSFYGRDSIPNYGVKVMRTFQQCVAGYGHVFHRCCHLANNERKSKVNYDTAQRSLYEKKREESPNSILP